MKVLYLINAGIMGGRERHVLTLAKSLPQEIEYRICAVSAGEATDAMLAAGENVCVLGGRNGHDLHVVGPFVRLLREFKPDIVHAHSGAFFPCAVLRFFPNVVFVQSIHGPTTYGEEINARNANLKWKIKDFVNGLVQRKPDYYLSVSKSSWEEFKTIHPKARGEIFYNALRLDGLPMAAVGRNSGKRIVGMVGRAADQKDWPSFCSIAHLAKERCSDIEFWGVGADEVWARENCGDDAQFVKWFGSRQDARDLIAQMDIFLMTSKHEQLPTTLLEAFAIGVPVAGFLPVGGTGEILELSRMPDVARLRKERDCKKTADDVIALLEDESRRRDMVTEGRRIVSEYFDMRKLCATQLLGIYNRLALKEKL